MCEIYFVSEAKRRQRGDLQPVNVQAFQDHTGNSVQSKFLLVHAFIGCDTTSAICSRSKGQTIKKICNLTAISDILRIMENEHASTQDVAKAGSHLMVAVYGCNTEEKLSTMRYQSYCRKVCDSVTTLLPEKLPPTEWSANIQYCHIPPHGLATDTHKTDAIINTPRPENEEALHRLLGKILCKLQWDNSTIGTAAGARKRISLGRQTFIMVCNY